MARRDYLPTREELLAQWLQAFAAEVASDPTAVGLTSAISTQLQTYVTAFVTALAAARNPSTNSRENTVLKSTCRAVVVAFVRQCVRTIQATATVTAAQKTALGITVADKVRSAIPSPTTKPVLRKTGQGGLAVQVGIADEATPDRKAKPFGVDACGIYSYVLASPGDVAPQDLEQWRFEGLAKRASFSIGYNQADCGKTTVIRAVWFGSRGEAGPVSDPIEATVAA
jgi:hypothetical protein